MNGPPFLEDKDGVMWFRKPYVQSYGALMALLGFLAGFLVAFMISWAFF